MTREQLEHLIRAASVIAADDAIVVVGSQAILGQFPDAPPSMRVSVEADLFPLNYPERSDLIDGSIGELSPFHQTFGYYAQGVGEETAKLPRAGGNAWWRSRPREPAGRPGCAWRSTTCSFPGDRRPGEGPRLPDRGGAASPGRSRDPAAASVDGRGGAGGRGSGSAHHRTGFPL